MEIEKKPLDVFLNIYFRTHKALGSKDRKFISQNVYQYIRWKSLFDYLKTPIDDPQIYLENSEIPSHIRYGMPLPLYNHLIKAYGSQVCKNICLVSNTRAPLTIRINPLKTDRSTLLKEWDKKHQVSPCILSSLGIYFHEKINLLNLKEFKEGLFEIQDESSQLASQLIQANPHQNILDYCAGSGGKTLAYAYRLKNTGAIYLNDNRPHILEKAKKRLLKAGITNVRFKLPSRQQKPIDWIIVDVPCSGTGTLRRHPDLKWKFNDEWLDTLIQQQRNIFEKALSYLSPTGTIVYMTCSILPQENEQQMIFFQKYHSLDIIEKFQTLPILNERDGFFAVSFKKNNKKKLLC